MRIRAARAPTVGLIVTVTVMAGLGRARAAPPPGGYWVSVELAGPRERVEPALAELRGDGPAVPDRVAGVPGRIVGRVATVQEAVAFVVDLAFDGPAIAPDADPLRWYEVDAPVPGGAPLRRHGAALLAVAVTGATPDGRARPIRWPADPGAILPEGARLVAVEPAFARVPLFAAPAPSLPPMRERHAVVDRSDVVFRAGTLDRCDGPPQARRCLRWAQVLVRHGDRFVFGWLPAFQVLERGAWVHGATQRPAAALAFVGAVGETSMTSLVVRLRDGTVHRRTIEAPMIGPRLPQIDLAIADGDAIVDIEGREPLRIPLDPELDRFERP